MFFFSDETCRLVFVFVWLPQLCFCFFLSFFFVQIIFFFFCFLYLKIIVHSTSIYPVCKFLFFFAWFCIERQTIGIERVCVCVRVLSWHYVCFLLFFFLKITHSFCFGFVLLLLLLVASQCVYNKRKRVMICGKYQNW